MSASTRITTYIENALNPGERAYVLRLTGHEKDEKRKNIVQKMNQARHKVEGYSHCKPLWELFKMSLRPAPENEYDPFAVEVWVSMKVNGEYQKFQIGYIKANDNGKPVGYNRSVFKWLKAEKVLRTVVLDIGADADSDLTWCVLGIVTTFDTTDLAKKCQPIENYGKEPRIGDQPVPKKEVSTPKHVGETPSLESGNYPTLREIDELITLHSAFEDCFGWEEVEDGETFVVTPIFMSQWAVGMQRFKNETELKSFMDKNRCYGTLEEALDLRQVEKDYGPIMASVVYVFSGKLKGPCTGPHAREVLRVMRQVIKILDESTLIHNQED